MRNHVIIWLHFQQPSMLLTAWSLSSGFCCPNLLRSLLRLELIWSLVMARKPLCFTMFSLGFLQVLVKLLVYIAFGPNCVCWQILPLTSLYCDLSLVTYFLILKISKKSTLNQNIKHVDYFYILKIDFLIMKISSYY